MVSRLGQRGQIEPICNRLLSKPVLANLLIGDTVKIEPELATPHSVDRQTNRRRAQFGMLGHEVPRCPVGMR